MPTLTVTEKEHWKDRITRRLNKKIDTLHAADPNLKERIDREARQQALVSLGLADLQAETDRIKYQTAEFEKRLRHIEREMLAKIRGVPADTLSEYGYSRETEVENAIKRRQAVHEDELLAASDIGQQILTLKAEREELLDTVWLATSPAQIRQLWTKVSELLGENQTQLQRDALAIEPAAD